VRVVVAQGEGLGSEGHPAISTLDSSREVHGYYPDRRRTNDD
jgi:hypothetical protein